MALVFSGRADRLIPVPRQPGDERPGCVYQAGTRAALFQTMHGLAHRRAKRARDAGIAATESGPYMPFVCFGPS